MSSSRPVSPGGVAVARDRGGNGVVGVATPRDPSNRHLVVVQPPYYGWGAWSPWYGYGYGWGAGYGWGWGVGFGWGYPYAYPYGYGYGPGYYGYGNYVGIGWAPSGEGGGGGGSAAARTGSIRLRVSPSTAQVYIDGALVGTVEEFNGLSNHLELDAGTHQLELRAAGYETHQAQITVSADKTTTERATLKKK